ncbi:precorrin-3B synthase [Pseudonocardia sediminis]|uniref:Precorrin-3B synthase n=1 Tax=Pseudonocardia sediminis TaxID=1397368 RepID=A0A4V2FQP5_PSEST|nr:precorrin-3B synthase [Pseudonocardia sediminis]
MPTPVRSRADACPGVLSPHDAADGALARIRLPGGVVTAAQLHAVADVADSLGDGAVHLTSRGNLQLRGLDRDDPALVRALAGAGLLPSFAHEKVRNVLASPASGITGGLADVRGLAGALDRALCARPGLAQLPGRFLFAIDDGRGDVAAERPDLCWAATGADAGSLVVAGTDTGLRCAPANAPGLLLDAAEAFLDLRAEHADDPGTRAWRTAELPDAAARIAAVLRDRSTHSPRVEPVDPSTASLPRTSRHDGPPDQNVTPDDAPAGLPRRASRDGGAHDRNVTPDAARTGPLRRASRCGGSPDPNVTPDGDAARWARAGAGPGAVGALGVGAVGAAPVLGELSAADARLLADLAPDAVVTPWRTILLPDPHDAADALDRLRTAGLVVDPGSPALRVSACAGRPGCAKSLSDVRTHARGLVAAGAVGPVHVVGCDRRCGAPHTPHADAVAVDDAHYTVDGVTVPVSALAASLHTDDLEESTR